MSDEEKAISVQVYAALIAYHLDEYTGISPEYVEEFDWKSMAQLASKAAIEGALALTNRWKQYDRHSTKNDDEPT